MSGTAKGIKKEARIQEKADQKYKGDITKVLDLVRGTMSYTSMAEMHAALKTVWNEQKKYGFEIVCCKQTYQLSTGMDPTFYGDVKFSIKMDGTEHICELQFQHEKMVGAKDYAHKHYEDLRGVQSREIKGDVQQGDDRIKKAAMKGNHLNYGFQHSQLMKEAAYDQVVADVDKLALFLDSGDKAHLPKGFDDVFQVAFDE